MSGSYCRYYSLHAIEMMTVAVIPCRVATVVTSRHAIVVTTVVTTVATGNRKIICRCMRFFFSCTDAQCRAPIVLKNHMIFAHRVALLLITEIKEVLHQSTLCSVK